jgi:NAD(P)-dependent dehydrogenase (short-subunit alcohol dehydrogenase family)
MGLLDGERALVTGGGAGIGRATCVRMAAERAAVAVLDKDADAAHAVAAEVGGVAITCDVTDASALAAAVAEAAGALGGLTVLFNNAGWGRAKALHRYSDEEWHAVVDVNLTATFTAIRAAVPLMQEAGHGSIVNMAGTTAVRPARGEGPYAAAKAGVVAVTQEAAVEYAPTIRVNCVSPGFIATGLTRAVVDDEALRSRIEGRIPMGRIGRAAEVAAVVVFLASAQASYVTGQNWLVDGGSMLPSHQADELLKGLLRSDG